MTIQQRSSLRAGLQVDIIQKQDQRTGKLTRGTVKEILTHSDFHPHGIKVKLHDGRVGRVAKIIRSSANGETEPSTDD
jgi:uncharacterized repeat protein (TIGR03833 family)